MTDLTTWLLERIAEDEAAARAARGPSNSPMGDDAADEVLWMARNEGVAEAGIEHFARHDPARVLAQCVALRAVVEACGEIWEPNDPRWLGSTDGDYHAGLERAVRALASIYAGAEGWDERWAL